MAALLVFSSASLSSPFGRLSNRRSTISKLGGLKVKDYDEHYSIRMRTMLQDQVADGVDLGLEDHLPSVQLLSLCVLMVAEMKILTIMMRMGLEDSRL